MALRKIAKKIISFVEMTMFSNKNIPCFTRVFIILDLLKERFKLNFSVTECKKFMYDLIENSTNNC